MLDEVFAVTAGVVENVSIEAGSSVEFNSGVIGVV